MQRSRIRATVAAIGLAVTLVSCDGNGDGDGDASADTTAEATVDSTAAPSSGEFCEVAQPLAEFNGSSTMDPTADFEELRETGLEILDQGLDLYDDVIDVAPDGIKSQIETLRAANVTFAEDLEAATSMDDFGAAVDHLATPEVLSATTELDTYLNEECGFGLTMGG